MVSDASIHQFIDQYETYSTNHSATSFDQLIATVELLSQQGIDLTLFPKQLMNYADRHFSENRELYSTISTLASQLLSQAKWYPHPLLLYKTLLFNQLEGANNNSSPKTNIPISQISKEKSSSQPITPPNEVIQDKEEVAPPIPQSQNQAIEENGNLSTVLNNAIALLSSSLQKLLS